MDSMECYDQTEDDMSEGEKYIHVILMVAIYIVAPLLAWTAIYFIVKWLLEVL